MLVEDQLKIDFHVHTRRSPDGVHSLRSIAKYALKVGLDGLAVTDHNLLLSKVIARDISREFGILIIPGIEGGALVNGKHWLGISIDAIPKQSDIWDINQEIRESGGISIAPHPFSRAGYHDYLHNGFDAVEGLNGTTPRSNMTYNKENQTTLPVTAGSDAHTTSMLGYTWTRVDADRNIEDILEAIREGRCKPQGSIVPYIHRTIMFYSDLVVRYISTSPPAVNSLLKQICTGSRQVFQEL
jgi:predicted metal-dependent phosphoesterase TrpH